MGWNGSEYVKRDKIMKISRAEGHYDNVSLHKNKKGHTAEVHRLVAENWVDNPNNYPQVMHIDEDKHNNRADNLKWGTAKENTKNYNINPHTMGSWLRGANQMPREWIEKELRYDK